MMQDVSTKGILYWAELPTVGSNVAAQQRLHLKWKIGTSIPIQMLRSWFQWNSSCEAASAANTADAADANDVNDANAVTAAATWEHYRWSIDGQACHTRNIGMCCSKAKRENRGEWEIKQEAEKHWKRRPTHANKLKEWQERKRQRESEPKSQCHDAYHCYTKNFETVQPIAWHYLGRLLMKMEKKRRETWWLVVERSSGFQSSRGPEFDSCYFQTLFIVSNLMNGSVCV